MKEIPLTQGKVALVDDEDYDYLMQWKWYYNSSGTHCAAVRSGRLEDFNNGKRPRILMHRVITKPVENDVIDHIDGNPLNNQKFNLRVCTQGQNSKNIRKHIRKNNMVTYKGVTWNVRIKRYIAQIGYNMSRIYLGTFKTEEEAALAYNAAAIQYHGEFAKLNEIRNLDIPQVDIKLGELPATPSDVSDMHEK